jgi:hypothetical protein
LNALTSYPLSHGAKGSKSKSLSPREEGFRVRAFIFNLQI